MRTQVRMLFNKLLDPWWSQNSWRPVPRLKFHSAYADDEKAGPALRNEVQAIDSEDVARIAEVIQPGDSIGKVCPLLRRREALDVLEEHD